MKNPKIAGLTAVPLLLTIPALAAERSNVMLIITDQQSYYMISAITANLGSSSPYGNDNYFKTPNLDRLVKGGYTFSNCHVASPLSTPSRFAMLTGESPRQYGVWTNFTPKSDKIPNMASARAMGVLFKNAGYTTHYGGKVHLPWASGRDDGEMFAPPTGYGFDDYLTEDDRQELADKGAEFLMQHKGKDPFLLVLSFINPHDICRTAMLFGDQNMDEFEGDPKHARDARENQIRYRGIYQSMDQSLFDGDELAALPFNRAATEGFPQEKLGRNSFNDHKTIVHRWFYYRLVEEVDAQIGKVLDAFDKSPYKDNTIIVFTSDHGEMACSHGLIGKVAPYEEAQRVPLVFTGKGIQKGVIDHKTIVNNGWDLLPTMLDLADIGKPDELHGLSLRGVITKGTPLDRKYVYYETPKAYGVLESGGRYKYTIFIPSDDITGNGEVLFDLEKDPGELHNLAADNTQTAKMEELRSALAKEMKLRGITIPVRK